MIDLSLAFDLDGTLVNSEKIKTSAYIEALRNYNLFKGDILNYLGQGNSEKFLRNIIIEYNPRCKDIVDSVLSLKNDIQDRYGRLPESEQKVFEYVKSELETRF